MIEELITKNEGKTLEFKENATSLRPILKTIVAFANTAGGTILIGVTDKNKHIVGVENPLMQEERLASAIADSIRPLMIPDIQVISCHNKELLVLQVHHMAGPFYLKSLGVASGIYVRLGSTNRIADNDTILALQMLTKNKSFDELPCLGATIDALDVTLIRQSLEPVFGKITKKQYASLGLVIHQNKHYCPSNAGVLLFSQERLPYFPDATINCVCFSGNTREDIVDRQEIQLPLIQAHLALIAFIQRNTRLSASIGEALREDIPQYPPVAIREVVMNAIVHTDYAIKGASIQVCIFSDRIEITNPGGLPYGQTIEQALGGVSRLRNRVIGRLFRELKFIERLGTGIERIMAAYSSSHKLPAFEELDTHFRVTLYSDSMREPTYNDYERMLVDALKAESKLSVQAIAKLWDVTTRTARNRLKQMVEKGYVQRIARSAKDPYAFYVLAVLS